MTPTPTQRRILKVMASGERMLATDIYDRCRTYGDSGARKDLHSMKYRGWVERVSPGSFFGTVSTWRITDEGLRELERSAG